MATQKKKISVEQIKQLMELLPVLDDARGELAELMREEGKSEAFLQPGLAWGEFYDMSVVEHIACFAVIAGLTAPLKQAAQSDDPVGELLKLDDHPDYQEWRGGDGGLFEVQNLLGMLFSLLGTVESVVLYGHYLNELVSMAYEEGDDESLFKAIRIDPMVVTSEKAAHRIALAVVRGDKDFLQGLHAALNGKTGRQARYLRKFRFLMQLLMDAGMLDQPTADLRSLVLELGAYADDPGAEKNLNEQIRKFRKKKPSQMSI